MQAPIPFADSALTAGTRKWSMPGTEVLPADDDIAFLNCEANPGSTCSKNVSGQLSNLKLLPDIRIR